MSWIACRCWASQTCGSVSWLGYYEITRLIQTIAHLGRSDDRSRLPPPAVCWRRIPELTCIRLSTDLARRGLLVALTARSLHCHDSDRLQCNFHRKHPVRTAGCA